MLNLWKYPQWKFSKMLIRKFATNLEVVYTTVTVIVFSAVRNMKANKSCFGHNFVPFCFGIACGILISIVLFLVFESPALFNQFWTDTHHDKVNLKERGNIAHIDSREQQREFHVEDQKVIERKFLQDSSNANNQDVGNMTIPIEVQADIPSIENPAWEMNLTPVHIPGYLTQELKLKKKVYIAIVNPSAITSTFIPLIGKTYGNDWVTKGFGDIGVYSPMGVDIAKSADIKNYHVSVASKSPREISAAMLYEVINNLCSEHIDTHHHFFIVNSNTYVRLPFLLNFTKRLDDSHTLWIGHKIVTDIADKQYTNDPDHYCSTGPGFVLSRHALQKMCPHITVCQSEYQSSSTPSGLQFARCALRFLNMTCVFSTKNLFYDLGGTELIDPYSEDNPYKDSISIHPMQDSTAFYRVHHFSLSQRLNETAMLNEYYHNIIQSMDRVLVKEGGMADDRLILGRHGNENKYQHGDVISWERIETNERSPTLVYSTDEAEPSRTLTKSDEIVLDKVKAMALEKAKVKYGTDLVLKTSTIFRRVVPGVGYQYMVDIQQNDEDIATVSFDQPYDRMRSIKTQFAPNVKVNFILPLQDGSMDFKEFMQMFEQSCMSVDRAQNVALLVVLYQTKTDPPSNFDEKKSETLKLLNLYKQKYPELSLRWINGGNKPFSHIEGVALAVRALPADTLICSINLFMLMQPEFLHHARLNTIPGEQLYFPAPFQRLENTEGEEVSKTSGFWRSFDYSLFCGYKQDLIRACGGEAFASGEDLFEKALTSGLDVFRAPEHSLSVRWHERDCHVNELAKEEQSTCEEAERHVQLASSWIQR
uniref:Hexosyltransferase n=1 Tax=Phallusia mammillata TaxID=59560 RepID=A0A6F9DA52_9ASCI|nr:chondroitin sulfate synthase 3-like [Phallusia mammillata]